MNVTQPNIIETGRLLLRPFEDDDAIAAHTWFADPVVMKYVPSGPDVSVSRTRERLARYRAHQDRHGFSKWLVLERASGRPIGDAGLLILEGNDLPEGWRADRPSLRDEAGTTAPVWVDLGFRFQQSSWRQGYATEAAAAWVSVAFGSLGLNVLRAYAHPENLGSLKVLERLGFLDDRRDTVQGMPVVCYRLRRRQP